MRWRISQVNCNNIFKTYLTGDVNNWVELYLSLKISAILHAPARNMKMVYKSHDHNTLPKFPIAVTE